VLSSYILVVQVTELKHSPLIDCDVKQLYVAADNISADENPDRLHTIGPHCTFVAALTSNDGDLKIQKSELILTFNMSLFLTARFSFCMYILS
jgi:hypothetical protein